MVGWTLNEAFEGDKHKETASRSNCTFYRCVCLKTPTKENQSKGSVVVLDCTSALVKAHLHFYNGSIHLETSTEILGNVLETENEDDLCTSGGLQMFWYEKWAETAPDPLYDL